MPRLRLLDLFCGAGGAAMGYYQAGFEVVGVDSNPQPHYPFEFHQADAMEYALDEFDAFHASPPCQGYSSLRFRGGLRGIEAPRLIEPTRLRLQATGKPYIIENVMNAPLLHPMILCGTHFDLGVLRHRQFECSFPIQAPRPCNHVGSVKNGDYLTVAGHERGSLQAKQEAMGISWMERDELNEAIPPAYTEYIGSRLLERMLKLNA